MEKQRLARLENEALCKPESRYTPCTFVRWKYDGRYPSDPKSIVIIKSYNPYEARYPNRRVISRPALHLMKSLRTQGYKVIVEPDDGRKLEYITQKGTTELLRDPLLLFLLNIPISLFAGILGAWIYDELKRLRLKQKPSQISNLVIEIDKHGKSLRYSQDGESITDARFREILKLMERIKRDYRTSLMEVPPDPALPYPIYLEHTGKTVGWAQLKMTSRGLKAAPAKIIDDETWKRIENGELKGLSISGLVRRSECSVCEQDYTECNHIAGKTYDEAKCTNRILEIDLCEISIVKKPVNPHAILSMKRSRDKKTG